MAPHFEIFADTATVLISIVRYGIALLIGCAGLVWGIIWFCTNFKGTKRVSGTGTFSDIPFWIRFTWLLTLVYGVYYYIYSMIAGGTPPTHPPKGGKYWLDWYGKSTEVTQLTYGRSRAHETVMALLIVMSLFAGYRLSKKIQTGSNRP